MRNTTIFDELVDRPLNQTFSNHTSYGNKTIAYFGGAPREQDAEIFHRFVRVYIDGLSPTRVTFDHPYNETMSDQNERYGAICDVIVIDKILELQTHYRSASRLMASKKMQWLQIALSREDTLSFDKIGEIVDELSQLIRNARFNEIDEGLELADPAKMSVDAVVALSRMTFPARHHLDHWQTFVARAHTALAERGEDDNTLAGLV